MTGWIIFGACWTVVAAFVWKHGYGVGQRDAYREARRIVGQRGEIDFTRPRARRALQRHP